MCTLPELPEIESVRRALAPVLRGRTLHVTCVGRFDMRARGAGRGEGSPRTWMSRTQLLDGGRVERLERQGKRLAIVAADGRVLVVQLGMSGQLVCGPAIERSHRHVEWSVGGLPDPLVFRDPRRFGGLTAHPGVAEMRAAWDAELGLDALDVDGPSLAARLQGMRRVKCALLDQATVAGIGNIYADEALHRAGIDPRMRCGRLPAAAVGRLAEAIRSILGAAVAHGGSTLRDHRTGTNGRGTAQELHAAYGRAGKPCMRCGGVLLGTRLGGRATVWCGRCQPRNPANNGQPGRSLPG